MHLHTIKVYMTRRIDFGFSFIEFPGHVEQAGIRSAKAEGRAPVGANM